GVEVLGGIIKPKFPLIREDGQRVGEILGIQDNKKNLDKATKGMEVSMSIKGNVMIGRQIQEGDVLYTDVPQDDLDMLYKVHKDSITEDMIEVIRELIKIKRVENPLYGISIQ
ncbi:MAG: translation initiation factor IF-2, partial [Metallosphaera sp.]